MKKIILCFFGVIPRSIKYTYQSIKKNIIDILKEKYVIEIYVFNLNIEDTPIDGKIVNQEDVKIIPYDYIEEVYQRNLDIELKKRNFFTARLFTRHDYTQATAINCFRQLYSEYKVGSFLEKNINNYDIAIVIGPDFYIANQINIDEIETSYINNQFYTTVANDAQGYTNGFYFGRPEVLIKPLKRLEEINKYLPTNRDYEYVLQLSVDKNNIVRNISSLLFFKIRANKKIFFCTINEKYCKLFSADAFNKILNVYNKLIQEYK